MSCATDGKNRVRPSTAIYRAVMMEFERQRLARGLSMAQVDDLAGTQDGYYAKMLYPDTPLGRQARWETVQDVADALFGRGFGVNFKPADHVEFSAVSLDKGASSNALKTRHWRHSRYFKDLGARGGDARAKKLSPEQRMAISRKAVRAWKRICRARRQAAEHRKRNEEARA